jgi:hypothetical protein
MRTLSKKETIRCCLETPLGQGQLVPRQSRSDFDEHTATGLCLRRADIHDHFRTDERTLFGRFLGRHADEFVIVTYAGPFYEIGHGEAFDTLAELRQRWELD